MPASQYGFPTNFLGVRFGIEGEVSQSPGGIVSQEVAGSVLKYGDVVYQTFGNRVDKNLESSLYMARFAGVVVGGPNIAANQVAWDAGLVGQNVNTAAGQPVYVMQRGICYVAADATGIFNGQPLTAGRTTSGRVLGDLAFSSALNQPLLAITSGGAATVKATNATATIVSGVNGTTTAANLAMAALSGTVTNGMYNVYVFRVAANGTTVTSAMGTEASTLAGVVWPTGVPTVAALGAVIIHPTGVGNFVGGTTALDSGTVIPNAQFMDLVRNRFTLGFARQDGGAAGTAVLAYISV